MGAKKHHIAAGEFKARCLQIMDQVAKGKQAVIVTKRGKPVVRIVPIDAAEQETTFGCLAGQLEIVGDIEGPTLPAQLWEALK